jgi:hypothetical protein
MSKDQVAQFFLGKSSSMTPVDQPESAAIRAEFYKKVTDKDASQVKSLWSKLVFTGKATMPKEVATAPPSRRRWPPIRRPSATSRRARSTPRSR